jgi:hypothetical protein
MGFWGFGERSGFFFMRIFLVQFLSFDYIIEDSNNFMGKGASITTLRTGYDPAKIRQRFEMLKREGRLEEARQLLKQLSGPALYSNFLERSNNKALLREMEGN